MNILADTCFWISLCIPSEKDHEEVMAMMETILKNGCHKLLVPHPVLYETLCTRMVKHPEHVMLLTRYFAHVEMVPDEDYVNDAYHNIEVQSKLQKGSASMVDVLLKLVANDPKHNVKGILTKNGRDFSEFCRIKGIPMIENMAVLRSV